jgi:hypothetical protein
MHIVRASRRRFAVVAVAGVLALSTVAVGCSTHDEATSRPCPPVAPKGTAVAISRRGAVGMAKVGLTPAGLKAQEKC